MQYVVELNQQKSIEFRVLRRLNNSLVRSFLSSLENPKKTQEKRFQEIVRMLSPTIFSKEHQFDHYTSIDEFRKRVPIRTYHELQPWLSPYHEQKSNAITTARVTSFVETSGTTAKAKWIPVTSGWGEKIKQAQTLWMMSMIHDHPMVATGKALTMISPAEHARTKNGLIVGSNTGRMQQKQSWLVRKRYPVPLDVFSLRPSELKQYVYLRFALQENITSWTTANPSMLLLLCRRLQEWKQELSSDLRAGTLRHGPAKGLTTDQRAQFESSLIATAPPFDWRPAKIWPLAAINCWKGGPASFFIPRLRTAIGGDVPIREVGITASEGFFAIPMGRDWDGGVLWTQGHILEFVDDKGNSFWSWELTLGCCYRLIITTETGLVRYDMNDIVEVVGFCAQTPVIRFVGKEGRYLNAVGEKVSEEQLAQAVHKAALETSCDLVGFTGRIVWGDVPHIELAVEGDTTTNFEACVERTLQQVNIEYTSKRESERLQSVRVVSLSKGTYDRFRKQKVAKGAPEGQVKDPLVAINDDEWAAIVRASQELC